MYMCMNLKVQIQGDIKKDISLTSRFSLKKSTELDCRLFLKLLWWIVYKPLVDFNNPRHIWCLPQAPLSKFYFLEGGNIRRFQDRTLKLLKVHNCSEHLDLLQILRGGLYFVSLRGKLDSDSYSRRGRGQVFPIPTPTTRTGSCDIYSVYQILPSDHDP